MLRLGFPIEFTILFSFDDFFNLLKEIYCTFESTHCLDNIMTNYDKIVERKCLKSCEGLYADIKINHKFDEIGTIKTYTKYKLGNAGPLNGNLRN